MARKGKGPQSGGTALPRVRAVGVCRHHKAYESAPDLAVGIPLSGPRCLITGDFRITVRNTAFGIRRRLNLVASLSTASSAVLPSVRSSALGGVSDSGRVLVQSGMEDLGLGVTVPGVIRHYFGPLCLVFIICKRGIIILTGWL